MAKKSPVAICEIKHKPNNEPKFHMLVKEEGTGSPTATPSTIFIIGCTCINDFIIPCLVWLTSIFAIYPLTQYPR